MFIIFNIANLNLYFSERAGINAGIITIIWRFSVFMTAFAERFIFGIKLKYFHWIGLISIFICTVLIGLNKASE